MDVASNSYYTIAEPSESITDYYNYNERTQSFEPILPSYPLDDSFFLPSPSKEYSVTYYTTSPDENSLYYYDLGTQNFYYISEPTSDVKYYYSYNPETGNFYQNDVEPSHVTELENTPDLYFYDEPTQSYYPIETPSPYVSNYFVYNDLTGNFASYSGTVEYPDIYSYDEGTSTYQYVTEPSDDQMFYYYDHSTQTFTLLANPNPYTDHDFSDVTQFGSPDLYTYDQFSDNYYYTEPTPYITSYYTYNLATQSYEPYTLSSYDNLFTYEEMTGSYTKIEEPTLNPETVYYYYDLPTTSYQ